MVDGREERDKLSYGTPVRDWWKEAKTSPVKEWGENRQANVNCFTFVGSKLEVMCIYAPPRAKQFYAKKGIKKPPVEIPLTV